MAASGFTKNTTYTWNNSRTLWLDTAGNSVAATATSITAASVKVIGTGKADAITLTAKSIGATLLGGSGDDSFTLTATTNMWVNGGAGSDTLTVKKGATVEFTGNFGSDTINLQAKTTTINLRSFKYADLSFASFTSGASTYTESVLVGSSGDFVIKNTTANSTAISQQVFQTSDKTFSAILANTATTTTLTASAATAGSVSYEYARQFGAGAAKFVTAGSGDTLIGGTGSDTYILGGANAAASNVAKFDGGDGVDVIAVTVNAGISYTLDLDNAKFSNVEKIDATAATSNVGQTLRGLATASDTLLGGKGADSIWSKGGADYVAGGAGADTFWFAAGDGVDTVSDFNTGADTARFVGSKISDLTFAWDTTNSGLNVAYNTASSADNVLLVGASATSGSKIATTADGKTFGIQATYNNYAAGSAITGTASADYIRNFFTDVAEVNTLTYDSNGGADTIIGGSGKDSVKYYSTLAYVDGGAGKDTLGDSAATAALTIDLYNNAAKFLNFEVVQGGNGADVLRGYSNASETLDAGAGNDQLWSAGGADSLNGGAGADTFWFAAGDGADTIAQATNTTDKDVIKFTGLGQGSITSISRDANDNSNLVFGYGSDSVLLQGYNSNTYMKNASFQFTDVTFHLITDQDTTTANTLTGGTDADVLIGLGDGNNTFDGKGGKDSVYGGVGNDTIIYKSDLAYVSGGEGTDRLQVGSSVYTPATINLSDSKYVSIEQLEGGAGADVLRGAANAETLLGGAGADALWGAAGNDVLNGGAGADTYWFTAGDGVDTIQDDTNNTSDVVKFYAVAKNTDVVAAIDNGDLNITLTDGSKLVLQSWDSSTTKVNKFTFDNGTYSLSSDAKTWTKI